MDAVLSSGHSGLSTRARTDQASIGGVASIVALALLLSGCEATQGAATLLADLYTVRVAVVRATGHQAVQARIRDGTILLVKLINPPFAALPDDARSGKARDIAKVAYAAYPARASVDSVSVEFALTSRQFLFLVFHSTESFSFKAAELKAPAT